jgi:hypothetical protein
MLQLE